ncbi:MAG: NINE protein [Clostridium sp.]|uniref:NINE protein n=1 Tax=Clostridium sp. TaxID=1506 RepID=UPI0030484869
MEITDFNNQNINSQNTKFCKHCGKTILKEAVLCTNCGLQVENLKGSEQPQVIINNSNSNMNTNTNSGLGRAKNKWVSFLLCLFLGFFGVHKFYEGKIGMGILYLLTGGLFGIGYVIDCVILLFKPNPYFV